MPVDYHGWTHRPKEEGGTDPIPGLVLDGGGGGAAFCNARREEDTSITGAQMVAWTDVLTSDQTVFGVESYSGVSNAGISIKKPGMVWVLSEVVVSAAALTWGINILGGGVPDLNEPRNVFEWESFSGQVMFEEQVFLCDGESGGGGFDSVGLQTVSTGTKTMVSAEMTVMWWSVPTAGVNLTDLL